MSKRGAFPASPTQPLRARLDLRLSLPLYERVVVVVEMMMVVVVAAQSRFEEEENPQASSLHQPHHRGRQGRGSVRVF